MIRTRRRALLLLLLATACGDDGAAGDAGPDAHFKPDAEISACGIIGATSECTGPTALRRCEGASVVEESCPLGQVCGANPATGRGAACLAPSGPCGEISVDVCSGPILSTCIANQLRTIDCREHYATCLEDRCTTPCLEAGVTPEGRCEGNAIRRCVLSDGVYAIELAACPAGTSCDDSAADTDLPACVATPTCAGIGPGGACEGDTVVRCSGGRRVETDCGDSGEVCAWGGASGYGCAAPGTSGARLVSGTVLFERRELAGIRLGPIVTRPARSAAVVLVDDDSGAPLASAATDDDGRYLLRHDATPGAAVHVLVVAVSQSAARPARVLRPDGLLHGFAAPTMTVVDEATVDVTVTERSGASPAFSIFDTLVRGLDLIRVAYEIDEPPPLTAIYARGLDIFTFATGTTMTVLGEVEDDDGYDDSVLLHELGHVVEFTIGRTSNPGGRHRLYTPEDPRLAWSEGFATYFSSVVRDSPLYVDTKLYGSLVIDSEEDRTRATATGTMTQDISENTVGEILWDLGDGGDGDDDGAPGPHAPLLRVEDLALASPTADRGVSGVDLVDFLDGYLRLGGAARCAATRDVVQSRSFPYDFAGPVSCP